MNIAFLSFLDPNNINNWSGTLFFMFNTLKKKHSVDWVGKSAIEYGYKVHVKSNNPESFVCENYAEIYGDYLSEYFSDNIYDVIIARDYFFISYLDTSIPIIYIGDTTFELFNEYLKIDNEDFIKLANNLEYRSIQNSTYVIYSSEWAKQSALKKYDAVSEKIKVIEFGANLIKEPSFSLKPSNNECNLLFIGRDWVNKGGPKAYDIYKKLKQENNINFTFTIVGCTPKEIDFNCQRTYISVNSKLENFCCFC